MRLFLDANIATYIAFFEGYLSEGNPAQLELEIKGWQRYQEFAPGPDLLREIEALRQLYLLDERAHFDWLLSDIAIGEIVSIKDLAKRSQHWNLLDRLLEHRDIVLEESGVVLPVNRRRALTKSLFPDLAERHLPDALQYAEALMLESDYFVTNDVAFSKVANQARNGPPAQRPSELPFL